MNKVTCVRGVGQRDEIGATPGDMDEGRPLSEAAPVARAPRDIYPRFHGRHRANTGSKPTRAFLESATKPWLMSLRARGYRTMQTVVNALAQRAAAPALLLAFVILSIAFYLAPIQVEVATLFYVGLLAPALGIAAMAGFIAWNWRVFWILLGAGFLATAFVVVGASNGGWPLPI